MTWAVLHNHWHELVSSLNVWKRGRERAVHKPLLVLMLLARAQRGESNRVRFSEIAETMYLFFQYLRLYTGLGFSLIQTGDNAILPPFAPVFDRGE